MYPDFQYLFQSIFHHTMPEWLGIFKTFGFLVAMAFIAAAWTLSLELKRKEKEGLLFPQYKKIEVGKAVTIAELLWSAVLGFILGFKVGGFFGHASEITPNPMGYLFSLHGNILVGIAGVAIITYSKYAEKKKQQLPEPVTKTITILPHHRIADIVVIAAVGGLLGAKIFNAFETWDSFIKDPIGSLISSDGLTFYGGLIVATASLYYFARKNNISFKHLCDAAAPGLILAYGIGRLGCHFSGDGDWGIFNTAYLTQHDGTLKYIADDKYASALINAHYTTLRDLPAAHVTAPSWLPDWTVAMNYPHNVAREGFALQNCTGTYCNVLPAGVFPTSLYEAIACILLFCILWYLRKRIKYPLHLFGIYLIFNGIERFFIEKIRVNYKYDWEFLHPTQAEIISTLLVVAGLGILLFHKKKEINTVQQE